MNTQNTANTNKQEPDFSGNPAELHRFNTKQNNNYNFEPECALPGTALSCLNGLRHGHRARTLFIPGEQPQDFYTMLAEDFETHKPASVQDSGLVTDATLARWYLWRRQRSYSKSEFELYCANDQEDTLNPSDLRQLEQFDRYRIQAERGLARAMAGLRHLKKAEVNEKKWRAQLDLQTKRFDLDRQRFELRKEQELFTLRQAEVEANKFKPADYTQHLGNAGINSVIEQRADVSLLDGVTQLELTPSNDVIQKIVDNRESFGSRKPIYLRRRFFFEGGIIPSQYDFIPKTVDPKYLVDLDKPGKCLPIPIVFDQWRILYEGERSILNVARRHREQQAA